MKTLAEIFDGHPRCDKATVHSYVPVYEAIFDRYRTTAKHVLEIGLFHGDSLRIWEKYFTNAEVYGIDCEEQPHGGMADLRPMIAEGTHRIRLLDATSPEQVEKHFAGMLFDVIVEDASHAIEHQLSIYNNFKHHLAPEAVYVIEDIQDLDKNRALFEAINPGKTVRVLDRRHLKDRYDDVLVVIR